MRIQRMMPGSAAYKEKTAQATTQTNMAYVLADVAESFAMDAMRNLAMVGNTFRNEEKQKWSDLRRLAKLMDARLRSITVAAYETQHDGDYEDSSDSLYKLMVLLCDRARVNTDILDQVYQHVAENFPPVGNENKED